MTAIFISYERSAAATAKRMAEELRAEGWEVWFDADLPPHRPYSEVIEEKLEAAGAVLVLWSKSAVASEWVRAEAGFARQRRKLVQVSLDGARPPIPFDQVQCAQLQGWRERSQRTEWRKVVAAMAELTSQAAPSVSEPRYTARSRRTWLAAATILAVVLLAGATWLLRDRLIPTPQSEASRAAILPFRVQSQSPAAHNFADGLADQIQSALTDNQVQVVSRDDAQAIAGSNRAGEIKRLRVRLLFDGAVQDDGKTTSVTVHLEDTAHHLTLWSSQFAGASDRPAELQAQIGGRIVAVLNCSARALAPKDGLADPQVLIQYLLACDLFARSAEDEAQMNEQMVGALRRVTAEAPQFPPAHAALAKFLAYRADDLPPDQAAASRREARQEAARALGSDRRNADAYVALFLLEPGWNWGARETLLRKGLAGDPDWPHANGFLALLLADMGRLDESVTYGRRAASANALGETWTLPAAVYLLGAGHTADADAAVVQYERLRPGSRDGVYFELQIRLQEARWNEALAILNRPADHFSTRHQDALRLYIFAGKSRTPEAIRKARAALFEFADSGGFGLSTAVAALSQLGLVDDAFTLSERYALDKPTRGDQMGFLFDSRTAAMRHDPRFLQIASRVGLLDYWRKSGKWPDFCGQPDLPYKCQ